ncbi:MAG: hypothetical protein FJW96_15855 [Actinobacteria bacterium]|nr:hypothetical protein [Actinomycetota bacterium]
MHLRAPSVDRGVQSFIWAVVFFLVLWLGMLGMGVSRGTSLLLAGVAAFLIYVFVRTHGGDDPRDKRPSAPSSSEGPLGGSSSSRASTGDAGSGS